MFVRPHPSSLLVERGTLDRLGRGLPRPDLGDALAVPLAVHRGRHCAPLDAARQQLADGATTAIIPFRLGDRWGTFRRIGWVTDGAHDFPARKSVSSHRGFRQALPLLLRARILLQNAHFEGGGSGGVWVLAVRSSAVFSSRAPGFVAAGRFPPPILSLPDDDRRFRSVPRLRRSALPHLRIISPCSS